MITKTMIVAALVLGSASIALAAPPPLPPSGFQTRIVALPDPLYGSAREPWMDRASRNWSGGGY